MGGGSKVLHVSSIISSIEVRMWYIWLEGNDKNYRPNTRKKQIWRLKILLPHFTVQIYTLRLADPVAVRLIGSAPL